MYLSGKKVALWAKYKITSYNFTCLANDAGYTQLCFIFTQKGKGYPIYVNTWLCCLPDNLLPLESACVSLAEWPSDEKAFEQPVPTPSTLKHDYVDSQITCCLWKALQELYISILRYHLMKWIMIGMGNCAFMIFSWQKEKISVNSWDMRFDFKLVWKVRVCKREKQQR